MGRGGSSSGGRSSGGGGMRSSGGRMSSAGRGGFGGSGRGGGFGGGGIGGGPRHGYRMPPPGGRRPPRRPWIYAGPRPVYGGYGGGGCGCSTGFLVIFLICLVVFLAGRGSSGTNITQSTIEREALPKGSVTETGYVTDELGWIRSESKLTAGMKDFYRATGVQPYLFLTDTVNGTKYPSSEDMDAYANRLYDEYFADEAHVLLLFHEYKAGRYSTWYVCGSQAKTVIDAEAADILLDCLDRYYYEDGLEDEAYFSKAFREAGKRIMQVEKSRWPVVFWIFGLLGILGLLYFWWKKSKEQRNREAEQTERMLNTPLETFGDSEIEKLKKKYDEE
ncbi:MAG: hypothetical protein HFI93_06855 [Lachnospiraceae bacterium]|nr:hypothetical protein [Lachnospiraceae bacterium]